MPTNPTPAAVKAAERIAQIVDEERHLKASKSWFAYDVGTIIDHALADERAAGEAMAKALETWEGSRESNKKLYGVNHFARNAVERIDDMIRSSLAAWRKARGQQ